MAHTFLSTSRQCNSTAQYDIDDQQYLMIKEDQ